MHKVKNIALDLDGTLAYYDGWKGIEHIGDPIPEMWERFMGWINDHNYNVSIFTARANDEGAEEHIRNWLYTNGLDLMIADDIHITNIKHKHFHEFWDDRAVPVPCNSGLPIIKKPVESAFDKQEGGSHYKNMAIQPGVYCHKNKLGSLESNIVKYVSRHPNKNGIEDLRKVIHTAQMLIELEYGDE